MCDVRHIVMCDVRHIVMCDVQHIVMQNTLLKLATVFKEHVHAQYVIRFHNVIKRVATMEDSNGSGRMIPMEVEQALVWPARLGNILAQRKGGTE